MQQRAVRIVKRTFLIAAACSLAGGAPLQAQPIEGQQGPGMMDCRQMRPGQFENLPDAQKIRCGGEEKTAGELRRELRALRQSVQEKAREAQAAGQAKLQELQKKYKPKISLEAAQTRMRTELSRLKRRVARRAAAKDQFAEIRQETAQLLRQMQTARASQERAKIQARANELLDQLRRMDGPPPDTDVDNPVLVACKATNC